MHAIAQHTQAPFRELARDTKSQENAVRRHAKESMCIGTVDFLPRWSLCVGMKNVGWNSRGWVMWSVVKGKRGLV